MTTREYYKKNGFSKDANFVTISDAIRTQGKYGRRGTRNRCPRFLPLEHGLSPIGVITAGRGGSGTKSTWEIGGTEFPVHRAQVSSPSDAHKRILFIYLSRSVMPLSVIIIVFPQRSGSPSCVCVRIHVIFIFSVFRPACYGTYAFVRSYRRRFSDTVIAVHVTDE